MKTVLAVLILVIFVSVNGASLRAPDPLHSQREVLRELYKQAKIDTATVEIKIFTYDYMSGYWHIELKPKDSECIDCYPAFYFKNKKELKLEKTLHG